MVTPLTESSRKVLVAASIAPSQCVRGIARYAREHDWHLVTDMMFTGSVPRAWKGDGVLAFLPYQSELLIHLQTLGAPCVALADVDAAIELPSVTIDHAEIGRLAADHLLQRAHRSFAWAPFLNDTANRQRSAAFQARLAEHGRSCRTLPAMHTKIGPYWQGNWAERRRALIEELHRLPRPTALFAFNDCVAADIIDACGDAGLSVPEDLAVLGVGNSIACETSAVPLSSIDDNLDEIGYRAASLLSELMNGSVPAERHVRVQPRGVVTRVSTDIVAVTNPRVARALSYIAENYPDPMLTVNDVASAVGMSRRNLERSVREETGCTINEHIVSIRMREASRLLRLHPRAKSSEIAALVGITGAGSFFRTFRRFFGMNPKAHRHSANEIGHAPEFSLRSSSPSLAPAQTFASAFDDRVLAP
jgi:LacI family transcriptional regulator